MSDCCTVNANTGTAPAVMACPVSGARSKQVDMLTVRSLVRQLPLGMPITEYYFCEAADCDVVYFPFKSQAPLFRAQICLCGSAVRRQKTPFRFATALDSHERTSKKRSPRQGTRRLQIASRQK